MSFSIALQVFLSSQMEHSELLHLMKEHNIPLNESYDLADEMISSGVWCYGHFSPKVEDAKQHESRWDINIVDRIDFDIVSPKSNDLLLSYEKGREKLFRLLSDLVNIKGLNLALTIELGETAMLLRDELLFLNPIGVRRKDARWINHPYEWKEDL